MARSPIFPSSFVIIISDWEIVKVTFSNGSNESNRENFTRKKRQTFARLVASEIRGELLERGKQSKWWRRITSVVRT